jgi:hypothetical protein
MFSYRHSAIALTAVLCACGSSGAGSSNSNAGQASYSAITLLSHEPADAAVQVPLTTTITMRFDARMVLDCTRHPDTWLRRSGTDVSLPGTWSLADNSQSLVFTPNSQLLPETDYDVSVSPLTCDQQGRILETTTTFSFRTLDETAPSVIAANVTPNQTGRSRTAPLVVTLSEAIGSSSVTPNSVILRDIYNQRYDCTRTVSGATLSMQPLADLPGDRRFTLQVGDLVTDRAGNQLPATWTVSFWTATDTRAPAVTSVWPPNLAAGISPLIQPIVTFDEGMDPFTVEPSSLLFQDEFGSLVAYTVACSSDQRTLRIRPNQPLSSGRTYLLAFLVSGAAVTDVSGNPLTSTQPLSFVTGSDAVPPQVASADPSNLATRVSLNAEPRVTFVESLDPTWVTNSTVQLLQNGVVVPAVLSQPDAQSVQLSPVLPFDAAASYSVRVRSGHDGLRDLAGNILAQDVLVTFATAEDATLPTASMQPADGAVGVPATMRASIVFSSRLDPATVSDSTCELWTDAGSSVPSIVALTSEDRVVTITPLATLSPLTYYRILVRGGSSGLRETSGNWLPDNLSARFRVGSTSDVTAPVVTATVNGIDSSRRFGLVLPTHGFSFDIDAQDGLQVPDLGSVRIDLTGPGTAPDPAAFYQNATIGYRSFRAIVPSTLALTPGTWTATVRVADLAGNVGVSPAFTFAVAEPSGALVPFERTQVVWTRTDLDRDGNGRADFDDDMLRLGLATTGDPASTNVHVRNVARDAILARANDLFGRGARGEPLDQDSVAIRFTPFEPIALAHLQIAVGGLDPQGNRNRSYGDPTTGVLGRAYYDYRNGNTNDRNIGTSPGLGVFPAEMFLYQADLHTQLYPAFQTMFAQRFLPLCPNMGGTPAGSHPLDATVLRASFNPNTATGQEYARWLVVMRAIDDWALVIGTVLAHEVGHAVGLVAPGNAPRGLFGDSSLHNTNASAAEVMAPAVGYEAMVSLDYHFRDTNMAYLRHRILLR